MATLYKQSLLKKILNKNVRNKFGNYWWWSAWKLLSVAAKKLNIKTTIYSDDPDAPAQNFCDDFIFGNITIKKKFLNLSIKLM